MLAEHDAEKYEPTAPVIKMRFCIYQNRIQTPLMLTSLDATKKDFAARLFRRNVQSAALLPRENFL